MGSEAPALCCHPFLSLLGCLGRSAAKLGAKIGLWLASWCENSVSGTKTALRRDSNKGGTADPVHTQVRAGETCGTMTADERGIVSLGTHDASMKDGGESGRSKRRKTAVVVAYKLVASIE